MSRLMASTPCSISWKLCQCGAWRELKTQATTLIWLSRCTSEDGDNGAQPKAQEPERIRSTFVLQTDRVEPAGAIYLWPQEVTCCSD